MGFSFKKAIKNVGNAAGNVVKGAGKTIEKGTKGFGKGLGDIGSGIVQGKWSKIEGGAKGAVKGYGKLYSGSGGGAVTTSEQGQKGVQGIGKGIVHGNIHEIGRGYQQYSTNPATAFQGIATAEGIAALTGEDNLPSGSEIASMQQQSMQQQQPMQQQGMQQQAPGLPPTGLQQQLQSLNNFYSQQGMQGGQQAMSAGLGQEQNQSNTGGNSLDQMARNLAQRYGMPIGRGRLVDDQGNFLMTPDQVSQASGGSTSVGQAATQMNYIAQAIARQQNEGQQKKALAALQTGLGQVQSNARGSLASMMSGYYQNIAALYSNQEYEAADFSYFIQREREQEAESIQNAEKKKAKKSGATRAIAGIGLTIAGLYTGNSTVTTAGVGMAAGGAQQAGWF